MARDLQAASALGPGLLAFLSHSFRLPVGPDVLTSAIGTSILFPSCSVWCTSLPLGSPCARPVALSSESRACDPERQELAASVCLAPTLALSLICLEV